MRFADNQIWAIVKAQWRGWLNQGPKSVWGMWIVYLVWYGFAAFLAWVAAAVLPEIKDPRRLVQAVEAALFLGMLYWQLVPILLASTGMSLDLKRLLVYPVEPSKLFTIEVILRLSTGLEVAIVLAGVSAGLWRHPGAPWWGPFIFLPYMAFNMFLSAGVRDLLARLMSRRGIRELVIFAVVLVSALPQLLLMMFPPERMRGQQILHFFDNLPVLPLPWTLGARTAVGDGAWWAAPVVLLYLGLGLWFGYRQFIAGLNRDRAEKPRPKKEPSARSIAVAGWLEGFYRLPSRLLPDPLGVLVEKEFRFLSRASRFRLVFFMGFSFGLIIWFPLAFREGRQQGMLAENFLVWVSLYATLMLGDVLFWNCFGFDRQAVQAYYAMPVRFSTILLGKNIAAVSLLFLEVLLVTLACTLFQIKVTLEKAIEAFAVTGLVCLFLLPVGNLMSVRMPRPADPSSSWRNSSAGKSQLLLLIVYPLLSIPVALAYLSRYAFGAQLAFYLTLAGGYIIAGITYYVAMESAVEYAVRESESTIAALSKGEGPIGA
ncbi:MAG: hypothetical protein C0504_03735 [Candidatus Solibacter sp.]|nr:hypothetical protein [Candidatus Solibacter sp.]